MRSPLFVIGAGAGLPPGGPDAVGGKAFISPAWPDAGLPVPPAFVLPTAGSRRCTPASPATRRVRRGVGRRHATAGGGHRLGLGSARRPLLVSVRSGGAVSMPGMLETVLDVGLNTTGS